MKRCDDVLIVDDDADMIEVIELVLQDAGYKTRRACNGQQALESVAADGMPAVIVLDMLMPVMNGWQFADAFHEKYGHEVPIVVATAAEHVRTRSKALEAVGVLPKPFEVSDLLREVGRHLRAPAAPPPAP